MAESNMVCRCGLPMTRNPHPDAGKPSVAGVAVGYLYECIPCLVATRNRVGERARRAEALCQATANYTSISKRPTVTLAVLRRLVHEWESGSGVR